MPNDANGLYEFGSFRLDAAKRLLSHGADSLALAPKTFDLLLLLVQSQGRVLNKRELLNCLWPDTFVEEASLSYQIATLRKTLGREGDLWIETVPKHGYRFVATVTKVGGHGVQPDDSGLSNGNVLPNPAPTSSSIQTHRLVPWGVAALALLAALVMALLLINRTAPEAPIVRFLVSPPESNQSLGFHAVSPDGKWLAFIASSPGQSGQLFVRRLDTTAVQPLTAAPMPGRPFWSPDSRSIAFFTGAQLMKIDTRGGSPQIICDAPGPYADGAWSPEGVILFHPGLRRALYQVAATGGEAKPLLALDPSRQETSHSSPQFLPDGRHFIFFIQSGRTGNQGIYIGSLDSKESKLLLNTDRHGVYTGSPSGSGHLLFIQGTTLMAQRFDDKRTRLIGEPEALAEGIAAIRLADIAPAVFDASNNGVLAYRQGSTSALGELVWFDRNGRRLSTLGEPAEYKTLALSPDETKLVVARQNQQTATNDLWMFDLKSGNSSRFTFDPADELNPVWSPDGSRIAFGSNQKGPYDIYQKSSRGTGDVELLLQSGEKKFPHSWSPDGRFLLYEMAGTSWALPVAGDPEPYQLPTGSHYPQISPNGQWVAYQFAESLHEEIYVQSVHPSGGKWQVSKTEGVQPRWRSDGKELFFIAGSTLMAAEVQTDSQAFRAGTPQPLFELRPMPSGGTRYQVADNGQRFLVNMPLESTQSAPITVVTNWTTALKK